MSGKKINKIVTRQPNLECGFLAGLLMYCESVRRHLDITTGKLEWDFISTATQVENPDGDPTTIYFNVGQGEMDQHGKPENASLCQLCSLDFVRQSYDFVSRRPWLKQVFNLVRNNDIKGTRISRHRFNLRELMSALAFKYQDDPQLVLDWLSLAFCGVFESCKEGVKIRNVFDPKNIQTGVRHYAPEQSEWFDGLTKEAIGILNYNWICAQRAVAKASKKNAWTKVHVPALGQDLKVIEVWSDSFKTGAAGRAAGFNIVIQWTKNGHCQIHGGNVRQENKDGVIKKWIHMGQLARELRLLEAKFSGKSIAEDQDWTDSGNILFSDGTLVPWYLPEFLTSLYNGTLSSLNVKPTKINKRKVFDKVCSHLKNCDIVTEDDSGNRQIETLVA